MQKALTSIAVFSAPVVRSPAATPSSSIIVASACAKAPVWFSSRLQAPDPGHVGHDCGQGPNPPHDMPLSQVHCTGGFAKPFTVSLQKVQNALDFPLPVPVEYEVLVDVPVVKPIGTARAPMSAAVVPGGGQSWLVGKAAPRTAEPELPAVHGAPSLGPPLHRWVVSLQTGHGSMAGPFTQGPPAQSVFVVHEKPAWPPVVAPLHRLGIRSPVR